MTAMFYNVPISPVSSNQKLLREKRTSAIVLKLRDYFTNRQMGRRTDGQLGEDG